MTEFNAFGPWYWTVNDSSPLTQVWYNNVTMPTPQTCTISNASPAVVTLTNHGFTAGTPVVFTTSAGGALPAPLSAGYGTVYYVIAAGLTANTFEVSATIGGAAINTTSAGSGTFFVQGEVPGVFVGVGDAAYVAWLAAGNTPSVIDTFVDLQSTLNAFALSFYSPAASGPFITTGSSPAFTAVPPLPVVCYKSAGSANATLALPPAGLTNSIPLNYPITFINQTGVHTLTLTDCAGNSIVTIPSLSGACIIATTATGLLGQWQETTIYAGKVLVNAPDQTVVNFAVNGTAEFENGTTTYAANTLIVGGNQTLALGTGGVRFQCTSVSYTDNFNSGTVAAAYTDRFGASTILSNAVVTYTNYYGSYFENPVASTNVTFTNRYALGADSIGINGGTLSNGTTALNITATMPSAPVAAANGISINITGNGSAAQNSNAIAITYGAGYTGANLTRALNLQNNNAGTASTVIPASGSNAVQGNLGISGGSSGTTTGANVGSVGFGQAGNVSVGVVGLAQIAKASATSIGVAGSAINTGASSFQIGGWFSLNQTTIPAMSAALIADNGSQGAAVALFNVAGVNKAQVDSLGNLGYITGAGGAVTQLTSKSTGVTINKSTGQITMINSALAGGASVTFTVTNSMVTAADTIIVNIKSGATANTYGVNVSAVALGSFNIQINNFTGTSQSDAIVLNFAIIKGAFS